MFITDRVAWNFTHYLRKLQNKTGYDVITSCDDITMTSQEMDHIYVPRVYVPNVLCAQDPMCPGSMCPMFYVPKALCAQGLCAQCSMCPRAYVPRGLCALGSKCPVVYVSILRAHRPVCRWLHWCVTWTNILNCSFSLLGLKTDVWLRWPDQPYFMAPTLILGGRLKTWPWNRPSGTDANGRSSINFYSIDLKFWICMG
jgi:hypothetical protein